MHAFRGVPLRKGGMSAQLLAVWEASAVATKDSSSPRALRNAKKYNADMDKDSVGGE